MARGLAGGGHAMTGITGTGSNTRVFELCRNPAGGAVTFVTGQGGRYMARGLAHCPAGAVTGHTGSRSNGTVIKL